VNCYGNDEVDGNGNKGGRQATVTATKRAMVTATRVVGNEKAMATAAGGDEGGRQVKATRATATETATTTATVTATTWAMMMATRLAGN
jgi:hypothetical protein